MVKPTVKLLTEYRGMHYSIYLATDSSEGRAYIFSFWKGALNHICPCCLLPEHRWDISKQIAIAANALVPTVTLTVYWLSPHRHANGKGFGEDVYKFNDFTCCRANFVSILEDELPLKIKEAIADLK